MITSYNGLKAQQYQSNYRSKQVLITLDTLVLDTQSFIWTSVQVSHLGKDVKQGCKPLKDGRLLIDTSLLNKVLLFNYRVFDPAVFKAYYRKNEKLIEPYFTEQPRFFYNYNEQSEVDKLYFGTGLNVSGNISRGLSVGNAQDVVLNSNLNLQMSGKLGKGVSILAAISDENNPIQPQGNTQQIQDFDKVYITIFKDSSQLTVGDFLMQNNRNNYFLKYYKKSRGLQFNNMSTVKGGKLYSGIDAAVSRGKFVRNEFQGIEGNQGPYRLTGANNEQNIIVISGTEVVYLDGNRLERGQQNDYVIDYNVGEIVFMPRKLINQFSRIVVEFQYSDRNYNRSVFTVSNVFQTGKWTNSVHYFTEQDSRFQPTDTSNRGQIQSILENAGDNKPLFEAIRTFRTFQTDRVNYLKRDSLGYDIYVFTNQEGIDSFYYSVNFSYVGEGKGNYILKASSANGRVFEWIQPNGTQARGSYEPYIELVAPQRMQMLSLQSAYQFSNNSSMKLEGAYSNYNKNTFSALEKFNDDGIGLFFSTQQRQIKVKKMQIDNAVKLEYVSKNFKFVERYRAVEFNRIWNRQLSNQSLNNVLASEFIGDLNTKFIFNNKHTAKVELSNYTKINQLDGLRLVGNYAFQGTQFSFKVNGENTQTAEKGFLVNRQNKIQSYRSDLAYQFQKVQLGVSGEMEESRFNNDTSEALQLQSFKYEQVSFNVKSLLSKQFNYKIEGSVRQDYIPRGQQFEFFSNSINYSINADYISKKSNRLSLVQTYRYFRQKVAIDQPQTVLGRLEYVASFLKKTIVSNSYYQVGTGREQKRQFSYLPVLSGTGTHSWIDYNGNGLEELNEFEVAAFKDQANYVKVFLPTNEFIYSYINEFNQSFRIQAPLNWQSQNKFKRFISRFNTITSYKADRRLTDNDLRVVLNPFQLNVADSTLITVNGLIKQTTFFNRSNSKFGIEHNIQTSRGKQFLNNGFEWRQQDKQSLVNRIGISKQINLIVQAEQSVKSNQSQFFENRNFRYTSQFFSPELFYQSSKGFRLGSFYKYTQALNDPLFSKDKAFIHEFGLEGRYFIVNRGNIDVKASRFNVNYLGNVSSPLGFDILNGLNNGNNTTWSVSIGGKAKNNLQINVSYEGRQNQFGPIVHIGRAEARYIF